MGYVKVTMGEDGRFTSELLKPSADPVLEPWEQKLFTDLNAWLDRPIGRLSRPVWTEDRLSMALHGSGIAELITRVQLSASGRSFPASRWATTCAGLTAR
jgi:hypothetical protein